MPERKLKRTCAVCEKVLDITVHEDQSYDGGHYFGKLELPTGEGENISLGKDPEFGREIVEWTGEHKELEYWECDKCFAED